MPQTTAPPTPPPAVDPVRTALDDADVRAKLTGHALSILGRWLPAASHTRRVQEADELIAETFQRAWQSRAGYDPARLVVAWLHGILTNVLHEYGRRLGRQPQPLTTSELPEPATTAVFEDQELMARLLDRLTPDDRNLVEWSLRDELSYRQIAERLQISEVNARVRLHRLVNQLRRQVQKEVE